MEPEDDLERLDDDIGASLRRHADELTGPIDTAASWADVEQRAGTRRRWRLAAASIGAAAAAAAVVVGFLAVTGDDREVLRAPATQPSGPTVTSPPVTITVTRATTTVTPATTVTSPPVTTSAPLPAPLPPTTVPAVRPSTTVTTVTPTSTAAPDPPASVTSYTSSAGSIDVRLAGGVIGLEGDPEPAAGWTVQIDDDGPDRVRVRFEREDERSEIRVDLTSDGRLQPRITEG